MNRLRLRRCCRPWSAGLASPLPRRRSRCRRPKITYDEHVRPIFREHCFTCHNPDTKKSDLALDSYAAIMQRRGERRGDRAGDPDGSRLWALVNHTDEPKMPPKQDKLPEAKLDLIKAWIAGGALENAGSTAKAKKPAMNLSRLGRLGQARRPADHARRPVRASRRLHAPARRRDGLAASPWAPLVAVAGQKQILLYHTDTGESVGRACRFPKGFPTS